MIAWFCSLAALYVAALFLRGWLTLSYARRLPPRSGQSLPLGTLTIVQPLLSGDPLLESRLEENLEALSSQPFIWLLDEDDREAQRIADKLARPGLRVERCTPCPDHTNPKLWKLKVAAPMIQTPFFAVIDDDTALSESSAVALVEAAKTHTVSTGLPNYTSAGFSSGLLAQFVNNNSLFTYLGTSRLLAPFTLNGMGYVMRREELVRIDHFKPILHELTDDLALATLVLKRGGNIHQSDAPLQVQTGVRNLKHYGQIMHRWYVFTLLLMRRQRVGVQALIFALHGLPPLILGAMIGIGIAAGEWQLWLLLLLVLIVRAALVSSLHRRFFRTHLHGPFTSVLSELFQPLHLVHALCKRTIRWRTRRYRVRDTDDFTAV